MLPLTRKKRLLLLDDDPSMQRLMARILRGAGYRVDIVSTGRQAIERVEKVPYAALLLDVMTPTEGGMTVIEYLRQHNPGLLPRVLLVTAAPATLLRSISRRARILRKPFEADSLLEAVDEIAAS